MSRKLRDSVVVVTGASSGIGRATALEFARKGASVVLTARREEPLKELARDIEEAGGVTLAIPCDVTSSDEVGAVARDAVARFGRIDVWVNNAGVYALGRFEETPPEVFRQVIETDFFGCVNGARAVLPVFREQGAGTLINVASVLSNAGGPYLTAYASAKAAALAFAESLRMELRDQKRIHVCSVLPATIDTPLFQHTANYTGRAPKPMDPIYEPGLVAKAIVDLARHPERERVVGNAGRLISLAHTLAPGLYERMAAKQIDAEHFQDQPAPDTSGNVLAPIPRQDGVSGGWKNGASHRLRNAAMGLGLAATAGWLFVRQRDAPQRT